MKLKWIPWVLSIVFMIFVLSRLTEYDQISDAVQQGDWRWIVVAVLFQGVYLLLLAKLYQQAFRTVGINRSYFSVIPVMFSAIFVSMMTPSAGMAGTAVYVAEGKRQNTSGVRTTTGFIIETIFQQIGFICVVFSALALLFLAYHYVGFSEMLMGGVVVLFLMIQIPLLALIFWKPKYLEKLLSIVSGVGNWINLKIRKKELISKGWSKKSASEMGEISGVVVGNNKVWFRAIVASILMQIFSLLTMYAVLLAFGQGGNVSAAVAGFVTNNVAGALLVGLYGIGFVEAGLTIVLTHAGIPSGTAALIAITYRGISFWIPLLIGFISFRRLKL